MAESKLQPDKQLQQEGSAQQSVEQTLDYLAAFGGFNAVAGFLPDAADMDPKDHVMKAQFLKESQFKNKRERLAWEIQGWLEILKEGKNSATEYAEVCNQKEEKYQSLLKSNLRAITLRIKNLETSYRNLDSFFKNAGLEKIPNIRLINVEKYDKEGNETDELTNSDSDSFREIKDIIHRAFSQLSLKDNYSLLVLPGYIFKDKQIRDIWAEVAHEHKMLLLTDYADCKDYDVLHEQTEEYKDNDKKLQNVILTANWLVGRSAETMTGENNSFFIPPSGALAGKLYNPSIPISQCAAGEKYGVLNEVKGVHIDMLKEEITGLWDNQVVPMVFYEGRVLAYHNTNLYTGDNTAMRDYPIVRVLDWVGKNLMHYVHKIALENWDPYNSPDNLKKTIQNFLNDYKGYGKLFTDYKIGEPFQDPKTKEIKVDIDITPYFAAKNFTIKLSADKQNKKSADIVDK